MGKRYFADIDDIVGYYVVPALGEYKDDFDVRNIAYFICCDHEPRGLRVDTDEFGDVLAPDGERVSFWDIARRFDLSSKE